MTSARHVCSAMTVHALLDWATRRLADAEHETPRLDAEVILGHVLDRSRTWLLTWGDERVADEAVQTYHALIQRRVRREPVAYIVGHRAFFNLDLRVTPGVLVPRPETEVLVSAALQWLQARPAGAPPPRVLDLGTGSGAIALAIAANFPACEVLASDVSAAALEVARENAVRTAMAGRVELRLGDLWDPLRPGERFDLILSNPPYVSEEEFAQLQPNVRDYEPRVALTTGPDGLAVIRRIVEGAARWLADDGALGLEIGWRQGDAVQALLATHGYEAVRRLTDLAGLERVVWARRGGYHRAT